MVKYVEVAPEANLAWAQNHLFTYKTEGEIKIGQEVIVPFGTQKLRAVVWHLVKQKPRFKTRDIIAIVDPKPVLDTIHFKLSLWLSYYYHCSLGLAVKLMLPQRMKRKVKIKKLVGKRDQRGFSALRLTPGQQKVFNTILKSRRRLFLLHGVTGSGKTEIYLRVCRDLIRRGQQAIILVPEISLTDQAIDRFSERFPGQVAVIHSRLSRGERFKEWERIRTGQAKIIIGPRSAIFAPVSNLGLIVLDEEHDSSFKQYDQNPRYHAREVALKLAEFSGAKLILGSATPRLESYYQASQGKFKLLALPQRIGKAEMPEVEIVDMRVGFKKGRREIISPRLQVMLEKMISQKKQAILFINRRGAATFVFCRHCGYLLCCPHCDVTLTYHPARASQLLCHYCNYRAQPPAFCPQCQSPQMRYYGLGTQKVEEAIRVFLPQARIARFDRDSTLVREAHKKIYYDFVHHRIDILVGTQMLTQGWDLPKVSLIGIISADSDLNLPDFRAAERTFTLLTQVAGRTGRGKERGQVILQTYNPDNAVIRAAAQHDYQAFYAAEIKNRKELLFPPFTQLVKLIYQHYRQEKAAQAADGLAIRMKKLAAASKLPVTLLGPAPTFIPRIRRRYRYQLILMFKSASQDSRDKLLAIVPPEWIIDVDPESLL